MSQPSSHLTPHPPLAGTSRLADFAADWIYADAARLAKWRTPGGDFLDANGVPNGPTPYATATATEARPQTLYWEVGALVSKLAEANTGIYLHVLSGANPPAAWRKNGAAPPRLIVVTDTGAHNCPCESDAYLARGADRFASSEYMHAPALLKFDLAAVKGVVLTATLTVDYFAFYAVPITIAAEYLDLPASATGTLPAFVPPPGTFAEFTLNTPFDARPPTLPDVLDIKRIFANWNSAAMISDYSARGGIVYHGGGEHGVGATDSCGVMMLNLETRRYEFRCRATQKYVQSSGKTNDPDPTNDFGEHADGSPGAPHTYNQACEFPAAWGGGSRGSYLRCGGTAGGSTTKAAPNAHNCAHKFDLSHEVGGTSRLTGSLRYGLDVDWGGNYAGACIDRKRQGWWAKMGSHAPTRLAFISKAGDVTYSPNAFSTLFPYLHHFSNDGQDVLLFLHVFNLTNYMSLLDLASGWSLVGRLPAGNPPAQIPASKPTATYAAYIGPRWSTLMNCFVGLDYSVASPTLCLLTPSNPADIMGSTWAWTNETVASHDGSALVPNNRVTDYGSSNGIWGKLIECPSLRSLVWTRSAAAKGQLIRPRGMK